MIVAANSSVDAHEIYAIFPKLPHDHASQRPQGAGRRQPDPVFILAVDDGTDVRLAKMEAESNRMLGQCIVETVRDPIAHPH
ncbi:MAG: hypothetical protein ACK4P4_15010 [Allorhizobium sp.]